MSEAIIPTNRKVSRGEPNVPTIAAGLVKDLLSFAVREGAKKTDLLSAAGLEATDLEDQDNRISFPVYILMLRAAKDQCKRPDLPLAYGANSRFEDFSIVGLICHAANTMAEAFEQMNRYAKLVMDTGIGNAAQRFKLTLEGENVWIEDCRPNPNMFPELTETTFSRFIGDFDRYIGGPRPFKALHVTHTEPTHAQAYDDLFCVPVTFGAGKNALLADKSWLAISFADQNRYTFGVLSKHAEALMNELNLSDTLRGHIEQMLLKVLHTGDVSMEQVADLMGISRATLFRRLKSEGINFEQLLDGLRRTMALHYLEGGKATVNEVAYLIGYSEASSFSRAFKRWTGKAPSKYK